jgi:hypothetical protein
MPNTYSITIKNESGQEQDYSLFSKPPKVTGKVQPEIFSNVFATALASSPSISNFTIQTQYLAVVGSSTGTPRDAVQVNVTQMRGVTLGTVAADGTANPGTTLKLGFAKNGAPTFEKDELKPTSDECAFAIVTPSGVFDDKTAIGSKFEQSNPPGTREILTEVRAAVNWMIGLGVGGSEGDGPAATFIPYPGITYNIMPHNTYYVIPTGYAQGSIIDVARIGESVEIDFTKYPKGKVVIVHDSKGRLTIQK